MAWIEHTQAPPELIARPTWWNGGPAHDWPEDYGLENGHYFQKCSSCQKDFAGHKRRHTCRKCKQESDVRWQSMTDDERQAELVRMAEAVEAALLKHPIPNPFRTASGNQTTTNTTMCDQNEKADQKMTQNPDAAAEMPRYRSHKEVWALKIQRIKFDSDVAQEENRETDGSATIYPEEKGYAPIKVNREYVSKHNPQAGGYYVVYADGYKSWSPAEAFEDGYTRV